MSWMDLLRMSSSSLLKRKLRTFLTVLGVIIGTTSIVVMFSLGLGMQKAMYRQIEETGGLNTITVTGKEAGPGSPEGSAGGKKGQERKQVTDQLVSQLAGMEHVKSVQPVYTVSAVLLKGGYEATVQLTGMTPEGLESRNIKLAPGGRLPESGRGKLELVYGNGVLSSFADSRGGGTYDDYGKLPDIDLAHDTLFLVLDESGYSQSREGGMSPAGFSGETGAGAASPAPGSSSGENSAGAGTAAGAGKPVRKYAVQASGVVAGGQEDYGEHFSSVYCDLDTLKQALKKEFAGRALPGQPVTKSGKPYREFCYSQALVRVDDIHQADSVAAAIRQMGYNAETNAEFMKSMKSQLAIIQAVLGGIGAVSLLVAAIGIANTMMMSIYERTKEIGVIKVLGCSLKNIRQMFLLEAAFIGLMGGAAGCVLSFAVSTVINALTATKNIMGVGGGISFIPPWLVLAAVGFSMLVGMGAGYIPALRAMRLSPLAAIQNG